MRLETFERQCVIGAFVNFDETFFSEREHVNFAVGYVEPESMHLHFILIETFFQEWIRHEIF